MPETKAMSVLRERPDRTIVLMFKLRLLHGHATQLLFQCRDKTGINLFFPFINHHLHLYECGLNEKHFLLQLLLFPLPPKKSNAFVQTKENNFLLCQSSCFTRNWCLALHNKSNSSSENKMSDTYIVCLTDRQAWNACVPTTSNYIGCWINLAACQKSSLGFSFITTIFPIKSLVQQFILPCF